MDCFAFTQADTDVGCGIGGSTPFLRPPSGFHDAAVVILKASIASARSAHGDDRIKGNAPFMPQGTIDPRVNPSDETIGTKGFAVRFLLTADSSNGSIAAFELMVPAALRLPAPAHSHDHYEETIYGLEGVLTWTVDEKQIEVGPGQALCIPRGAVHRFDNNGSQDVKALCVITPAAIGPEYFREAFAVLNAAAGGPPDRAEMAEIMRRYGLTPAVPPT
jgi:quercetin dioxygenase-like cupin family protein